MGSKNESLRQNSDKVISKKNKKDLSARKKKVQKNKKAKGSSDTPTSLKRKMKIVPSEDNPARRFYESLYAENPASKMARSWLTSQNLI